MALRAGYNGIKKFIARKINVDGIIPSSTGRNNPLVTKNEYDKLLNWDYTTGVRNILPPDPRGVVQNVGITYVINSDGSVSMTGTTTATAVLRYNVTLQPGKYRIWGYVNPQIWCGIWDTSSSAYIVTCGSGEPATLIIADSPKTYQFTVRVGHPSTVSGLKIYPMITYADEPDDTNKYVPYAETNKMLTDRLNNLPKPGYDISTTEFDTGNKWVDGKTIYGKKITAGIVANAYTGEVDLGFKIDRMIDIAVADYAWSGYSWLARYFYARIDNSGSTTKLALATITGGPVNNECDVVIYYTKPTVSSTSKKSTSKKTVKKAEVEADE